MWIEYREGTATLTIVPFGQVIGAVPVSSQTPRQGAFSAWTLDPQARSFRRSRYPAVWHGTAAARLTDAGYNVVSRLDPDPERSFLYIADGLPTCQSLRSRSTLRCTHSSWSRLGERAATARS